MICTEMNLVQSHDLRMIKSGPDDLVDQNQCGLVEIVLPSLILLHIKIYGLNFQIVQVVQI